MEKLLSNYLCFMRVEKNASPLSISSYRSHLEKFIKYLRQCGVGDFKNCSISTIREYVYTTRDSHNLSVNSVRLLIAVLKSFFNYLTDEELIGVNPTRKIKLPKRVTPVPRSIEKFEIEKILSVINYSPSRCRKNYIRDKLIIALLYYAGLRKSELLALNWDDIDLGKSMLTVKSGKGRKYRTIPIHQKVRTLLELYLEQRLPLTDYALFVGEQGKRLNKNSFANLLKMYLALSGLDKKGYSPHCFRHAFASHLVEAGADVFTIQKLLGHESLDSTRIYITLSAQKMVDAVQCLQ